MCNLCDETTRAAGQRMQEHIANELSTLSIQLRELAMGAVKPHSRHAQLISIRAKNVIKMLAEEWL